TITLQGNAVETNGKQTTLQLGAASGVNQIKEAPATVGDYNDPTPGDDSPVGQPFATNVQPVATISIAPVTCPAFVTNTNANNTPDNTPYSVSISNAGPYTVSILQVTGSFSGSGVMFVPNGRTLAACTFSGPGNQNFTCALASLGVTSTTLNLVGKAIETNG